MYGERSHAVTKNMRRENDSWGYGFRQSMSVGKNESVRQEEQKPDVLHVLFPQPAEEGRLPHPSLRTSVISRLCHNRVQLILCKHPSLCLQSYPTTQARADLSLEHTIAFLTLRLMIQLVGHRLLSRSARPTVCGGKVGLYPLNPVSTNSQSYVARHPADRARSFPSITTYPPSKTTARSPFDDL